MNFDPADPDSKRWNCALNLFIESIHRADHQLRTKAKEVECYEELMWIRNDVDAWVRSKRMKE